MDCLASFSVQNGTEKVFEVVLGRKNFNKRMSGRSIMEKVRSFKIKINSYKKDS